MTAKTKPAAVGERLPCLLSKLKAPRVLERLEQTAERARAEEWPYEQFLEALLEAEVFARDASGARQLIRHAGFPALKTLEDFDWQAQPAAERPLSCTWPSSPGSTSTPTSASSARPALVHTAPLAVVIGRTVQRRRQIP